MSSDDGDLLIIVIKKPRDQGLFVSDNDFYFPASYYFSSSFVKLIPIS